MSHVESVHGADRPRNVWIMFLMGRPDAWGPAAVSAAFAAILHDAVTVQTTALVVAIASLYWLGYAINDYFDAPLDAQDEHKAAENMFVRRAVPRRTLASTTLLVEGVAFVVFGSFGADGVVLFAIANLAMWGYSARPVRLKSKPGLDLLTHGLFVLTFPYFVSLHLIDADWSRADWVSLGLAFFTSVAGQLRQQIRDFEVDSRTDVNFTTTVGLDASILAVKVVTGVTTFIFVVSAATGVIPPVVVPLGMLCLPAALDRVTARRAKRPPRDLYRMSSIAAVAYSAFLICASLFYGRPR